jgi:hypothetical protein
LTEKKISSHLEKKKLIVAVARVAADTIQKGIETKGPRRKMH